MQFEHAIADLVADNTPLEASQVRSVLEVPPEPTMGDYAMPCFVLAKELKQAPPKIASDLALTLQADFLERVEAKGPYLNFFIDKAVVAKSVFSGAPTHAAKNKKLLFEYPSPNTNKPLHLGHMRNMLLGDSASRICEAAGYEVVRTNLNNDRGIHICKSMLAYERWGEGQTPQDAGMKPDHFVGKWYVEFSKRAKEDERLNEQAQEMLRAWEQEDEEVLALWEQMNEWAHQGFTQTYERLGISHDKEYYEHEFYERAKQIVLDAHEQGVFEKDENGNIVAPLSEKLGDKVVLRADGTAIYSTQDIGLTVLKEEDFSPDEQVFVVATEQDHYFRQLFAIFDLLGYEHTTHHLSYGLISLPDGRMKSREGNVVDCDDLLDEVEALAADAVRERHPELPDEEVDKRKVAIGHAALRFYMLKYEPRTNFVYDAQESISLEGETGPYVQYTHARICSILRKADHQLVPVDELDVSALDTEEDQELLRLLLDEKNVVEEAARDYKPHLVARYALAVAQSVNGYYHKHHINSAEENVKQARLVLFSAAKDVIARNLQLLGIQAPHEM